MCAVRIHTNPEQSGQRDCTNCMHMPENQSQGSGRFNFNKVKVDTFISITIHMVKDVHIYFSKIGVTSKIKEFTF